MEIYISAQQGHFQKKLAALKINFSAFINFTSREGLEPKEQY